MSTCWVLAGQIPLRWTKSKEKCATTSSTLYALQIHLNFTQVGPPRSGDAFGNLYRHQDSHKTSDRTIICWWKEFGVPCKGMQGAGGTLSGAFSIIHISQCTFERGPRNISVISLLPAVSWMWTRPSARGPDLKSRLRRCCCFMAGLRATHGVYEGFLDSACNPSGKRWCSGRGRCVSETPPSTSIRSMLT